MAVSHFVMAVSCFVMAVSHCAIAASLEGVVLSYVPICVFQKGGRVK